MTVVYEILFISEILYAKSYAHTYYGYTTHTQKLVVALDNVNIPKKMNNDRFGLHTVSGLTLEAIEIRMVLH